MQISDDWRKELTRAVRDFAAEAPDASDALRPALVTAMLEDIGNALGIDCCAIFERGDSDAVGYHWYRAGMPSKDHPFEPHAFQALIQHATQRNQPIVLSRHAGTPADGARADDARAYLDQAMVHTAAIIPTGLTERPGWAWMLGSVDVDHVWPDAVIEHLALLGDIVSGVFARARRQAVGAPPPIAAAAPRRPDIPAPRSGGHPQEFEEIIGASPALRAALARLDEVVNSDANILLLGETGTGKELFARALHARGPRHSFPMVSVNCAALPPTLIESELFGHQRGAFTGAIGPRQGRFELAHHGTLFLDEIGDLPMELQPKLLRVLQEGAFERVGASQTQAVDVRIIAATHRDLAKAIADGEFRPDLYYRLNVFPIRLPPLRERREDLPALVWAIVRRRQRVVQRHIAFVPASVMETLQQYSWPGNIRELENVIERALIHSTGDTLTLLEDSFETEAAPVPRTSLRSVERAHIEEVLRDCGWRINGIGNAAERLGLHPNTLRFRMKKLGIIRHTSVRPGALASGASEASGRAS